MQRTGRWFVLGALVALLAACGTTTGTGSGNTTAAYPTVAATATTTISSAVTIGTGSANVKGSTKTVLTDAKGMTLYYRTDDTATQVKCTAGCLSIWPPVLATSGTPTAMGTLPGMLTVLGDAQRPQAEYNGHPLYTFASDTAAGQANGEGIAGIWYVVTPDLAVTGTGY